MGRGDLLNNYADQSVIGQRKIKRTLEYASRVICVSDALAAIAGDIVSESKVVTLANGANPARFPTDRKADLKAEMGLSSDATIVLFCGGFTERKGIHEIAEALHHLPAEDVHCIFVGHYGQLRPVIMEALMESPVESYEVHWQLSPLALRRLFAVADIVLQPSHAEGRPNTIYEAMASETAVIGSRVSGIPEQVVDGETGVLIPPKNSEALADALNRLLDNQPLRARMGELGKQRLIEKGWTWEAHGRRLHEIHRTVLEETTTG